MLRFFLIVLGVGVAAVAAGFIYVGNMPYRPHIQQIRVVLPNDHFGSP